MRLLSRSALPIALLALGLGAWVAPAGAGQEPAVAQDSDRAAHAARIDLLLAQERWEEALAEARAAQAQCCESPALTAAVGRALFRAGHLGEALTLLERLAEGANPADVPARAWVVLARLRAARGLAQAAVEAMERALALAPDDPAVVFWSSELAPTRAEACRRLERFLELSGGSDPDREEAARGTLRVYRQLGERSVWGHAPVEGRVEIPLSLVWDDLGRQLGYALEVRLDERKRPVRVLLDTGSGGLFLVDRVARKRGLQPLAEETTFGGGGKGRHRSRRGVFERLSVGPLLFTEAMVTTSPKELESHGRFHGVLGLSVFGDYRVTLDLPRKLMVLEAQTGPSAEEAGSPYWNVAGQMLVAATVAPGREGLFLFDTGANATVISETLAGTLPDARLEAPARVRGFGGEIHGARFVRGVEIEFQTLKVGSAGLRAVDLSIRGRLGGVELAGYLGMDLLDGTIIVIDTLRRSVNVRRPPKSSGRRAGE